MKLFKKLLITLLLVLVVLATFLLIYTSGLKPTYNGQQELSSLNSEVTIHYDQFGVPHIYADNNEDAYRALGFAHAQDRLWQMELMRRIGSGRLAEILGEELVETDKYFKTIGIHRQSKQEAIEFLKSDSEEKKYALAYLEGVNSFILEGPSPIEFLLLGVEKETYTLEDVYNVMGYIAFSFAQAQKHDPIFTSIHKNLGSKYLIDLNIEPDGNTEMIPNYPKKSTLDSLLVKVSAIENSVPAPSWLGSNSWIVNPKKSTTGNVIFANDPHMQFSQPGVWYEAHIVTPTWERYGYHAALIPFALLMHNRDYAIGMTMFLNDDVDFYYNSEISKTVEEEIIVKGENSVTIKVDESAHGPIMNDVLGSLKDESVAMWWAYLQIKMESMQALYHLNHAKSIDDVRLGASKIKAPGLNIMYGDAKGNIAWWASAQLYTMDSSVNRRMILDAKDSTTQNITWIPFHENPQSENPLSNYVYSTNNQPDTIKYGLYPGYYAEESRAVRLVELMESKEQVGVQDYQQFFLDHINPTAAKIAHEFARVITPSDEISKQALEVLRNWDGSHMHTSTAPVIYEKLLYHSIHAAMMNKIDSAHFEDFFNTHLMKSSLDKLIHNDKSVWWDDLSTDEVESRADILNEAFKISINELTTQLGEVTHWKWGNIHTLEHPHPMGQVAFLRPFFNVGIFKMDAADGVLNKMNYKRDGSGEYKITTGPSTRRLINFGDIENSVSILPTGQSGNPFSDHYNDQAELYANGEWRKMLINKTEIETVSQNTLVLTTTVK